MSLLPTVIITSILSVLFLAYAVFAYRYFRHSPWNATWQGITLLSQKVTMAALVAFYITDTIIPGIWPGRYSLLIFLLALLMVEAVATLIGLLHVQRSTGPVSRRQGTGYADPENIQTDPKRITTIHPDKETS
ncbi:hypothetical protein [Microbacterium aerolatum]|uniref:putative phage holin n=1 Tax=Microbacterium aerolatum TaxID=153731 RepID=UPI0038509D04